MVDESMATSFKNCTHIVFDCRIFTCWMRHPPRIMGTRMTETMKMRLIGSLEDKGTIPGISERQLVNKENKQIVERSNQLFQVECAPVLKVVA